MRRRLLAMVAGVGLLATACGNPLEGGAEGGPSGEIIIGASDVGESLLLAQIYAGALRNAGAENVTVRPPVGGREVVVKALEDRLGAPLFVRERGRARLTPLGARLLPSLSQACDAIESAFASHRSEDEQLLTVTTTHTFANTWLAWRLGAFQM